MASRAQTQAAKRNVRKAAKAARQKESIASMPKSTRTALGKQGAAVAQRGQVDRSTRREQSRQEERRRFQPRLRPPRCGPRR